MFATLSTAQKWLAATGAAALAAAALAFVPSLHTILGIFDRPEVFAVKEPPAVNLAPPSPLAAYDAIAARPLFNLDRKPDPALPAKVLGGPTALGDLSQYRLTGVIRAAGTAMALVQRTGSPTLTLKKGDTFDGWTVQEVDDKGVTVAGGDRSELLAIPKAENRAQPQ